MIEMIKRIEDVGRTPGTGAVERQYVFKITRSCREKKAGK